MVSVRVDDKTEEWTPDVTRYPAAEHVGLLSRVLAAMSLLWLLAGCASTGVVSEADWSEDRKVVEGYALAEADKVFSHGLTQIDARALERPDMGRFILSGLTGLADIESLLSVVDTGDRIKTYFGSVVAADLDKPKGQEIRPWLTLLHASIVGARRQSERLRLADPEQIYAAFFDTALSDLDSYSRYAGRLQARSNRETRNGFGGIGLRYVSTDLGLEVRGLQPNAPGSNAGLQIGDVITHVDGRSLADQRNWAIRRLLRGPIGSSSTFTVLRERLSPALSITVERSLIVPQTVELQMVDNIAVIEIHSFNQQTSQTVEAALKKAIEVTPTLAGVILDLRGDPGGLLDQSVTVSDLFMDDGPIVSTQGRHPESIQRYQAFDGDISAGRPVAVLVDSRSASASEIVAAAIQDSGRGLVVGTSSYGKGTVQTVVRLPNEGEITLTWSRFHAPDGYAIEDLGVMPMVCTSGQDGPVSEVLGSWRKSSSQIAERKAAWRTVSATDVKARAALRSQCPAQVRSEDSIDLEVAKALILNETLYAQAIGLTATTAAQQRP